MSARGGRRRGGRSARLVRAAFDAMTGRRGLAAMVVAYASAAVILLAYVSGKVYTSALAEEISSLRERSQRLEDRIGVLTMRAVRLASRERVARICEEELGMVPPDRTRARRVCVAPSPGGRGEGRGGVVAGAGGDGPRGASGVGVLSGAYRR